MRVAIYARVSTGEQTTENQRRELARVAAQRGWEVVEIYDDNGVSGARGREYRRQFDRLLKDATRGKFDLVAAWSVDRLGRSLVDLVGFLKEIHAVGVGLYLHVQAIDTTTPAGRAMFQMMGVFAEFERAMIVERVKAGMQRARAEGKHIGRRPAHTDKLSHIRRYATQGLSKREIARRTSVPEATVRRVLAR
jgi:DNA invertase Pin-like site-specific DNA recombinase